MSHHNREGICILDDELLDPEQLGLTGGLVHCSQCSCFVCVETAAKVRSAGHTEINVCYTHTTAHTISYRMLRRNIEDLCSLRQAREKPKS